MFVVVTWALRLKLRIARMGARVLPYVAAHDQYMRWLLTLGRAAYSVM